uniref:Tetrapyrrole methylase family protein n=1 Tax=uncultured Cytophagia bacterium TaxID=768505 RepID=H6RE87_9BACT|nr:tetrapyrrole methylase family protein [uncultured bacterium]CCF99348.1 tetrapyrrole methylase family protein [uncultured Cytophagia bacterium]
MKKGQIYMIPTTLGDSTIDSVIPKNVQQIIIETKYFIVENIKTTRRFLKKVEREIDIDELQFFVLNKHTSAIDIESFLNPALEGNNMGVISEAGCPGIADPGSDIVRLAHSKNIKVVPLIGPSSILLALIASGMNGQSFCFNGYLPKEKNLRIKEIKELERRAINGVTQIFMETPFRNNHLMEDLLKQCDPNTTLCLAADISLENEFIQSKKIIDWKKTAPSLNKRPCMFLIG